MKRLLLAASILALCIACDPESGEDPFTPTETAIDAVMPALEFGVECKWQQGEPVSIFAITGVEKDGAGHVYTDHCRFCATSGGYTTTLKGEAPAGADTFFGLYPYSEDNQMSGSTFSVIIPRKQRAATAQTVPFPLCAYAVAYGAGQQLIFTPLCAWVSFGVDREGITAVTLDTRHSAIAGKFGAISEDGKISITQFGEDSPLYTSIEIEAAGTAFRPGEKYYAMVIGNASWGFDGLEATIFHDGSSSTIPVRGEPVFLEAGSVADLGILSLD